MRSRNVFFPAALALLAACASDPTGVPARTDTEAERSGTSTIGSGLSVAPATGGFSPAFGSGAGIVAPGAASLSSSYMGSGSRSEEDSTTAGTASFSSAYIGSGNRSEEDSATAGDAERGSPAIGTGLRASGMFGSGYTVAPQPALGGGGSRVETADSPYLGGSNGAVEPTGSPEEEDSPGMGGSGGRSSGWIGTGS